MGIIEQFMGREAGPVIQFIKYGIGGGLATGVHIVIFHLTAWKIFPALQKNDFFVKYFKLSVPELDDATRSRNSMIDHGVTFVFSNFCAYVINILWVFEGGRHGFWVEIGLFYLVSGVSIAICTAFMGFLIKRFGMRTTYAFMANIVAAVLINYAMRKFFIFKG